MKQERLGIGACCACGWTRWYEGFGAKLRLQLRLRLHSIAHDKRF